MKGELRKVGYVVWIAVVLVGAKEDNNKEGTFVVDEVRIKESCILNSTTIGIRVLVVGDREELKEGTEEDEWDTLSNWVGLIEDRGLWRRERRSSGHREKQWHDERQ